MRTCTLFGVVVLAAVSAGCSGEEGGGASDPIESLLVAPDGARIDSATTIRVRATGVTASGRRVEVDDAVWTASSGEISADGPTAPTEFTPAGVGTVTITAEAEGLSADATIEVVAGGTLDVVVVDAVDGTPIQGASVSLVTGTASGMTVADGTAQLTGAFEGAIDLHVEAPDHFPVTLFGLKAKNVRIPVRPANPPASGDVQGAIDFQQALDREEPEAGTLWIGFAGPAIRGNVLSFGFDALVGPNRTINVGGLEVEAPSNIYVYGVTEEYIALSPPGTTAVFALGGEVTLQEISDVLGEAGDGSDLGSIVAELIPIFNRFYYALDPDVTVTTNASTTGVDLTLDTKLSKTAKVSVATRPVEDPNPLVVAAVDLGPSIGFVPVGLNVVDGSDAKSTSLKVPPLKGSFEGRSYVVLAVTEEGGLGSGTGDQQIAVLSRSLVDVSDVELPDFFPPPTFAEFDSNAGSLTFEFPSTEGSDLTYSTLSREASGERYEWDVFTDGESEGFALPMIAGTHAAATGGNWTVQTLGLESQTYEALLTPGAGTALETYFDDANRIVITNAEVE